MLSKGFPNVVTYKVNSIISGRSPPLYRYIYHINRHAGTPKPPSGAIYLDYGFRITVICSYIGKVLCSKKNLNASRPSEHPPVIRGGEMSKRLGGIIVGCKLFLSRGSQFRPFESDKKNMKGNTGEVHIGSEGELYKYINHHAGE